MSAPDCHAPAPAPRSELSLSALTVALVGRPNSGKSSLFNRVTGGDAHVGNFPGITVDILEADVVLPDGRTARVVDLPGLYSLDAEADPDTDEGIARGFLDRAAVDGRPLILVQVLDANQLALGLRLTRELLRRPFPLLVVATQQDVLRDEGRAFDQDALATALGVPVLAVSARAPATRDAVLSAVTRLSGAPAPSPPLRTPTPPAFEPDALARAVVRDAPDVSPAAQRRRTRTARADALLLHPVLGPVLFVALMAALFAAVFLIADPVTGALDSATKLLGAWIARRTGEGLVASFLSDGLLGGAGTVLAFLPQIVILTIAMELLEATGYLARGAFLIDRLLRAAGLGGRSFIPLLTAHACAVPAISATRIMRDPRERLTTILVLPLMTCSARIPTYSLLISTFFGGRSAWVKSLLFVGLYFAGIASGLVAAAVLNKTVTRGRRLPLVLEMPAYRTPEARAVARVAGRAAWRFVRDVGTTIVVASAVLWALLTVPMPGASAPAATSAASAPAGDAVARGDDRSARMQTSVAAGIGRALEPVTRPLGFDWRINVGLIGSFGARELMVSTLGVIFGIEDAESDTAPLAARVREARTPEGARSYSPASGLALMAFFIFACQCMSTVAAMRRETGGWRWPAFVVGYTYAAGYLAALVVYQLARALGLG